MLNSFLFSFQGKCCALYDDGLGRVVEDYSRPCSECSFRYQSDDILNGKFLGLVNCKLILKYLNHICFNSLLMENLFQIQNV